MTARLRRLVPAEDRALLRRQAADALRTLVRPRAYAGAVREVAMSAFHLAAYPLGVIGAARPVAAEDDAQAPARDHPLPDTADMPVVLVHGYVHNRSAFLVMTRALRRAGFRHIYGFNHNPWDQDISEVATMLAAEVERALEHSGAERVQIVAHSMGGLAARYYVSELGGDDTVDTIITLGTPHRGTYTSYLGIGPGAHQMRPGSGLLAALEAGARPSHIRWIAYYSDLDLMVTPAVNAKLVHPALAAHNIRLRDTGHLSLLVTGEVLRSIVELLADRSRHRPADQPEVAALPTASRRRRGGTPPRLTLLRSRDASAEP